jgi:hypothetical protein
LDRVAQQPAVDEQRLRAQVDGLDWSACAYAKDDQRVEIVTTAALALARRTWAGPYALRQVVERDVPGAADEDVQRILSDMLGQLDAVTRPTTQAYAWQA